MTLRTACDDARMVHFGGDCETARRLVTESARGRGRNMRGRLPDRDHAVMTRHANLRCLRMIDNADVREQSRLVTALASFGRRRMIRRLPKSDRAVVAAIALPRRVLEPTELVAGFTRDLSVTVGKQESSDRVIEWTVQRLVETGLESAGGSRRLAVCARQKNADRPGRHDQGES